MGFVCAATFPSDVLRAIGEETRRRLALNRSTLLIGDLGDQLRDASGSEVRLPGHNPNYHGTMGDPGTPQCKVPEYPGSPSLSDPTPRVGGSQPYFVSSGVSSNGPINPGHS